MGVLLGSDVVQLDHVAALEAALERALAGDLKGVESVSRTGDLGPVGLGWGGHTVSQLTWWESAGKPVQPAYCSSPAPLTMMGSSIEPA